MRPVMKRWQVILFVAIPLCGGDKGKEPRTYYQGVAVYGGISWSRHAVLPELATIPEISMALGSKTGPVIGVAADIHLTDHLAADNGLFYWRRGTVVNWSGLDTRIGRWKYDLEVVSLPVTFRLKPFIGSSPYILAGYDLSILGKHTLTESMGPGEPVKTDLKGHTWRVDLELIAGAGVEFVLKRWAPFVEARYVHGLLDVSRGTGPLESYPVVKSRAFVVLAGVRFKLKSPEPL